MKKTTAFFLTIGILAIIIGGSGSFYYYNKVDQSILANGSHEEYTLKNADSIKEATITLNGNAHYTIQTENSKEITLDNRGSRISTIKSSLDVKETNQNAIVNAEAIATDSKIDSHNKFDFGFSFFNDFTPSIILTIPSSIEKLTFKGNVDNNVVFSNINTKKMTIDFQNAEVSCNSILSDALDISINNGNLYLNQVKGAVSLNLKHGNIDVTNLTGSLDTKIDSGDFRLSGRELPQKLTAIINKGTISIDTEEILYDIDIKAKSDLGKISIFETERSTYKKGTSKRTFNLENRFGDITIDGPSNDTGEIDD